MMNGKTKQTNNVGKSLEAYYRFHSVFYDLTRWTFLFGRRSLVPKLPDLSPGFRIMEVGCGTGNNLRYLISSYPDTHIYGIDLSPDMLNKAEKKVNDAGQVKLIKAEYGTDDLALKPFDLILLSYSLTLTGNQLNNIIQKVHDDLKPGGHVAVIDFHQTPVKSFRRWMKFNHVDMDGAALPILEQRFKCRHKRIRKAYGGLWTYFQFIGQRVEK